MTASKFFTIPDGSMADFEASVNNWFIKNPEARYVDFKIFESTAVLFYEGVLSE